METFKKIEIAAVFVILSLVLNSCATTYMADQNLQNLNPPWAPAYYPGVRYYYIPDIETYYDLENQDFIYLDNGQWLFSYGLPSIYSGFDLYTAYVVALNVNVYRPWMQYQYYVSHYPRYYYRSRYGGHEYKNIRGFNENERKPFYSTQENMNRRNEVQNNVNTERRSASPRPPQNPQYYGRKIGRPVRVRPQMRINRRGNQGQPVENRQGNQGQKEENRRGNQGPIR